MTTGISMIAALEVLWWSGIIILVLIKRRSNEGEEKINGESEHSEKKSAGVKI